MDGGFNRSWREVEKEMSENESVYKETWRVDLVQFIAFKKHEYEKGNRRAAYLVLSEFSYLKLKHECAIDLGGFVPQKPYKFLDMEMVVLEGMGCEFIRIGGEAE